MSHIGCTMACMNGFYMFTWSIEDPMGGWDVAELHGAAVDFQSSVRDAIERYRDSFFTSAASARVSVYRDGGRGDSMELLPRVRFQAPGLGELRLTGGELTPEKVGGFPDFDGPYRELDRDTAWKSVPDDDVTVTIDWPALPRVERALPTGCHVLLNGGTGRYVVLSDAEVDQVRHRSRGLVPLVEATGTTLDWLPDFIDELERTVSCPDQRWSEIFLELDDIALCSYGSNLSDFG